MKPILFLHDPEIVHDIAIKIGNKLGKSFLATRILKKIFVYQHPSLEQNIHHIHFPNPIGLAAGFDKNGEIVEILPSIGFGFAEIGSITGEPCAGNAKPRLWRLPKSKGLLVYYGLKNDGCQVLKSRLMHHSSNIPIGISIAKTNSPDTIDIQNGIADYVKAFATLESTGDYITINISCPNTHGGEPFTDPGRLDLLLSEIDKIKSDKPIFLKLPCDISIQELDSLISVMDKHRVHGAILSNLTKNFQSKSIHQNEIKIHDKGGVSGKPTSELSNQLIKHMYKVAGDRYTIIGCGGTFSAEDAYEKIKNGASLVQLITGMIYKGPQLIGKMNYDLVKLMRRDGFEHTSEAIGVNANKIS